jgi:EF hand
MSIPICGTYRMMPMRRMHCMQKPDASEIANQMINNFDKDGDGALNADELGKLSDRMMPMRRMHCMQKPDASEIANQMINNRDKDGDGALSTDELGKLSDRMGLVETDFNDDGLIDQEKLISKISEKLEKMEGLPKMRGLKIYRICMDKQMAAEIGNESNGDISEAQTISETESPGAMSDGRIISETESPGAMSEAQTISETESPGAMSDGRIISETESPGAMSDGRIISETESPGAMSEAQTISDLVKQLLSKLDLSEEETEIFLETMKNYGINVTA